MEEILSWSRSILEITPRRWDDLLENLAEELLYRQPAEHEWSALECLQHLVDTERVVFPVRVDCLLRGVDFPAYDPDKQGTSVQHGADLSALAHEFRQLRQKSLMLFDKISSTDLQRQARHSELGVVTLSELLHEWAGHDLMHTVQAERALMQYFIEGSGPWQVYFADHMAT